MLKLVLIFCLSVSVRADPAGQRAVGWFTTGDYNTKFTDGSKKLLAAYNLANKNMVRDKSVSPKSETIGWTQILQCFFGCEEEYLLTDYYQDGEKTNPVMKVFVAKSKLSPPDEFNTSGYKKLLHFGFLYYGGQNQAIFFVLHPNKWEPYQHRFKTNAFTKFFNAGVGSVVSGGTGALVGAAIGSLVPVPVVGTVVGGLAGAAVGSLSDDYFGDYLRYIG